MTQLTFANFLVAQAESDFDAIRASLEDEAHERGGAYDYDQEDYYAQQRDMSVGEAASWS